MIDILILTKDDDGSVDAMELSDIENLGPLQQIEAEMAELLAEEDVVNLAAAMDPGSTAGVLIWENLWAARSPPPPGVPVDSSSRTDASRSRRSSPRSRPTTDDDDRRRLTCP